MRRRGGAQKPLNKQLDATDDAKPSGGRDDGGWAFALCVLTYFVSVVSPAFHL